MAALSTSLTGGQAGFIFVGMKIHVRHILVAQKYEADDVQHHLDNGKSFEDAARKFSKCPSAAEGGDLGEVDSRRFDPDFAEAAEALSPGEVSDIVRTRFGYHLIQRIS